MSDGKVHEICHDGRGSKEWQRIAVIVREEYNSSGSARAKRTNLRNKIAEATRACGNAPEVERPRSKAARRRRALKGQTSPSNDTPNTVGDISTWAPKPDGNEIGEYGIPGLVSARSWAPAPKAKRQAYTGEEATKLEAAVKE